MRSLRASVAAHRVRPGWLRELRALLDDYPGETAVNFEIVGDLAYITTNTTRWVDDTEDFRAEMQALGFQIEETVIA